MVELSAGNGLGVVERVHEELVTGVGTVSWGGVAVEVDTGGWSDDGVDVPGVADWCGLQVELTGDIAVDQDGDQGEAVSGRTMQCDAEEHVVKSVVGPAFDDACPALLEEVCGDDAGFVAGCEVVDLRVVVSDSLSVGVQYLVDVV